MASPPLPVLAQKASWDGLYSGPWVLTGNVAKVKVLHELHALARDGARVLDVGCVGGQPLQFWEPLLLSSPGSFHLSGVDVHGIERARDVARGRGWEGHVALQQGSGYELDRLFPAASFQVVVATQVLEHCARLPLLMRQVSRVLAPGGHAFFTTDSAHWHARYDPRDPVRLVKNLAKKALSLVGNERHYDLPWYDREIAAACRGAGLMLEDTRFYNLILLKAIHNHVLSPERKNAFMRRWFELEEALNDDPAVRERYKHAFSVIYVHARKG